jgi:signal peptidase I
LLYILVVALFVMTFAVQPFRIPSPSMEPTLLVGDFLLVDKQPDASSVHGLLPASSIQRRDVVVFHFPVDPNIHLVKRVIGLPGERLHLRNGRVYIDGTLLDEPYAVYRHAAPDRYRDNFPLVGDADPAVNSDWFIRMHRLVRNGELTIPPGQYFVMGDNRNDSDDSRYWGLVPRAAIVGKPLLVYFSLRDRDPDAGPVLPGTPVEPHGLLDFARWDRTLRIVR